jgi:hypothetical protein
MSMDADEIKDYILAHNIDIEYVIKLHCKWQLLKFRISNSTDTREKINSRS